MGKALKLALLIAALLVAVDTEAQVPTLANCTRSANLLACVDGQGNAYSVNTAGTTIYLRGFESAGNRYWAQTNSRYGQLTFFTGIASDGEAWGGLQPACWMDNDQPVFQFRRQQWQVHL